MRLNDEFDEEFGMSYEEDCRSFKRLLVISAGILTLMLGAIFIFVTPEKNPLIKASRYYPDISTAIEDKMTEPTEVNNKDLVKDPNKNPFGYTTAQTAWRSNVLRYVTGTEQFREDLISGVITDEVMQSWGLRRHDYPGRTVFHMIEDDIFPFAERRDVLTFTYNEPTKAEPASAADDAAKTE